MSGNDIIAMMNRVNLADLTPGLWWAATGDPAKWTLLVVRDASYRPDDWFVEGHPKVEGYVLGWDCSVYLTAYDFFVSADLVCPDGSKYVAE